jgi:hypothetical protein
MKDAADSKVFIALNGGSVGLNGEVVPADPSSATSLRDAS